MKKSDRSVANFRKKVYTCAFNNMKLRNTAVGMRIARIVVLGRGEKGKESTQKEERSNEGRETCARGGLARGGSAIGIRPGRDSSN